jgi:hypothetical protein
MTVFRRQVFGAMVATLKAPVPRAMCAWWQDEVCSVELQLQPGAFGV